jgi:hypothetical protein
MSNSTRVAFDPKSYLGAVKLWQCPRACSVTVLCLSFASILFSGWAVRVGWNNTIFDAHGFRQSQTAISVYYTKWGSECLNYKTPVLGPPWSIPFEFPLFQAIVAAIWHLFPLQLDQAGRLTAVAFFYMTFPPLFVLLRELKLGTLTALATVALFAVSPQYIFWSRTFMIESTAICLAVTYLMFVVLALNYDGARGTRIFVFGVLSAVAGALAGVVKVTTYAPFLLGALLLIGCRMLESRDGSRLRGALVIFLPLCAVLIPVLSVAVWTAHADSLKDQSTYSHLLTSHMLRAWNFGTLRQRVELASYAHFAGIGIGHVVDNLTGNRSILFISCGIALAASGYTLRVIMTCLALYGSAIAIFFNLHFVHTYYAYSNGIFLVAAVGVAVGSLLNVGGRKSWIGVCFFSLAIGICIMQYFHGYYRLQRANAPGRPAAAAIVDRETKPSDILLIYGLDWSAELPYQAHRRAIMLPSFQRDASLREAVREESVNHISSLLICDEGHKSSSDILTTLHEGGVNFTRRFDRDGCEIYLR